MRSRFGEVYSCCFLTLLPGLSGSFLTLFANHFVSLYNLSNSKIFSSLFHMRRSTENSSTFEYSKGAIHGQSCPRACPSVGSLPSLLSSVTSSNQIGDQSFSQKRQQSAFINLLLDKTCMFLCTSLNMIGL